MYQPKGRTLHYQDDDDLDCTLCDEPRTRRNCTARRDKVTCTACIAVLLILAGVEV